MLWALVFERLFKMELIEFELANLKTLYPTFWDLASAVVNSWLVPRSIGSKLHLDDLTIYIREEHTNCHDFEWQFETVPSCLLASDGIDSQIHKKLVELYCEDPLHQKVRRDSGFVF
jgi:hypothetical protein